jgi:hypothetical protein
MLHLTTIISILFDNQFWLLDLMNVLANGDNIDTVVLT